MKCPHCAEATLVMSERQGIEIDYCPQCRGVWLDRGELDKLIERSAGAQAPAAAVPAAPQGQHPPSRQRDFVDSDFEHQRGYGYKRKKSWLSEIFD